ncbi:NADH-quinone oxidoreductase subunit D [Kouleothrix sp.]|uniref:hydrogenase large subunit n=1 Tax=Kouleothrix sp. TaxID=2779161 RepID=UPI00391B9713
MTYSLALGPFHPALRGPQRFELKLHGEQIADIEYHDGFNERGCAERLPRLDLPQALHLVSRICGTCSLAHTLAFCQALEALCAIEVPGRAQALRCVAAELERIASHARAAAAILRALGMDRYAADLDGPRELALTSLAAIGDARVIPNLCLPGGVRRDLTPRDLEALRQALPQLNRSLYRFADRLIDHRPLLARTVGVGVLPRAAAEQFGVHGPLARASGIARDTRLDQPYACYAQLDFKPITQDGGDVYARLILLLLEAYESAKLIEQALEALPGGEWRGEIPTSLPKGQASAAAEGPRGAIRYSLESDGRRLTHARIDAPRQLDRLLARTLLSNALIDNAVAIIASADVCTACAER